MGRATSGVQGMRFNAEDRLLSLNVVREDTYLLVATAGGYAKRTAIDEYTRPGPWRQGHPDDPVRQTSWQPGRRVDCR